VSEPRPDAVGEFTLPGIEAASLGPDKYGAQEELPLWIFDPTRADTDTGFAPYGG
jgi:hypothetical protein